jgi:hypothetical protein
MVADFRHNFVAQGTLVVRAHDVEAVVVRHLLGVRQMQDVKVQARSIFLTQKACKHALSDNAIIYVCRYKNT